MLKYIIVTLVFYCFFAYHYTKHYGPLIIYSESLLDISGKLNGLKKGMAKAAAPFPPFVILRYKDHQMNETRIRHEQIHHLQYTESLFILPIYEQFEGIYARHILGKSSMEAYLRKSGEQEAYLNQTVENYIKTRKAYSILKYLKNKTEFELIDFKVILK